MNLKRGILLGIVIWVLIFFEVSVLMFGFKFERGTIPYLIPHFILLVIFILGANFFYFRDKRQKGVKEGLILGIVMVVVGIILDAIITVPLFIIPSGGSYGFLLQKELLIGDALGVIISVVFGSIEK